MEQIFTIIWLRFILLTHKLRSASGLFSFIIQIMFFVFGAMASIAMAVGFGAMTHMMAQSPETKSLLFGYYIIFYTIFFFGVISPLFVGTGSYVFEPSRFLIFPITRKRLYEISMASCFGNPEHLFNYPALLAVFIAAIIINPSSAILVVIIILLISIFYVVWGYTLLLILQSMLKKRKTKEIIAIISFMLLVALSIVPSLVLEHEKGFKSDKIPYFDTISHVAVIAQKLLPPSLAAEGLFAAFKGERLVVLPNVLALCLWVLAGIGISYHIFMNYHLAERGKARKHKKEQQAVVPAPRAAKSLSLDTLILAILPQEIVAVASKDFHYIFRSTIGKFNFFMMPLFVIIMVFGLGRGFQQSFMGFEAKELIFFATLIYSALFSSTIIYNSFGWDGDGVKLYFLCPVSPHKIIIGKNIALWGYNAILFAVCMVTWIILAGMLNPVILMMGLFIFSISIINFTIGGNITSIISPLSRDMSSMKKNSSPTATLVSLLSMAFNFGLIACILFVPMLLEMHYLLPILLFILLSIQLIVYYYVMKISARLFESRKENIIESLRTK